MVLLLDTDGKILRTCTCSTDLTDSGIDCRWLGELSYSNIIKNCNTAVGVGDGDFDIVLTLEDVEELDSTAIGMA